MDVAPGSGSRIEDLGDRLVVRLRPCRSWGRLAFMLFWVAGWTAGGVLACGALVFGDATWGERAFLLLWLCGWTFGECSALAYIAWQLFGVEVLSVTPEALHMRRQVGRFARTRRYDVSLVRSIEAARVCRATRTSGSARTSDSRSTTTARRFASAKGSANGRRTTSPPSSWRASRNAAGGTRTARTCPRLRSTGALLAVAPGRGWVPSRSRSRSPPCSCCSASKPTGARTILRERRRPSRPRCRLRRGSPTPRISRILRSTRAACRHGGSLRDTTSCWSSSGAAPTVGRTGVAPHESESSAAGSPAARSCTSATRQTSEAGAASPTSAPSNAA